MTRIAFVCHGNICRSPMAEFVFKNMINTKGKARDFLVVSRATSDEEIWQGSGNPIHHGTLEIFKKYNIPYDKIKKIKIMEHCISLKLQDGRNFGLPNGPFTKGSLQEMLALLKAKCPQLKLPDWQ